MTVNCATQACPLLSVVNFSVQGSILLWGWGWQLILTFKLNPLGKPINQLVRHYSIRILFSRHNRSASFCRQHLIYKHCYSRHTAASQVLTIEKKNHARYQCMMFPVSHSKGIENEGFVQACRSLLGLHSLFSWSSLARRLDSTAQGAWHRIPCIQSPQGPGEPARHSQLLWGVGLF